MAKDHESKVTQNHDEIRRWAEERGGEPATVKDTMDDGEPGILRFMFDDSDEDDLARIEWDAFFDTFDEKDLYLLYQEETEGGGTSRFFKFVDEDTADEVRRS